MSLLKTVVVLAILVLLAVFGLTMMRSHGIKLPLQQQSDTIKGMTAGSSVLAAPAAISSSNDTGVIALSNDPRRAPAPVAAGSSVPLDAETARRYAEALDDIEVDACNANGTVAVRVRGERAPHMVRNGQSVKLPHDFEVTLRLRGYPNCRVMLYDGRVAIGEVAGF